MDIFAQRLKWLREKKGFTQKEVAEHMGVSQQYYGRFEKGIAEPNLSAFASLREYLGEPLEFLLGIYNMDNHAARLFSILRDKKRIYERQIQRVSDFIEVVKSIELNDEQISKRISRVIKNHQHSYSEKFEYEKSKQYFIEYFLTIPGVTEDMITDQLFDELHKYYDEQNSLYMELYTEVNEKMFSLRPAEKDTP